MLAILIVVGGVGGCGETEEAAYEEASRQDSAAAYRTFLTEWPGSEHREAVGQRGPGLRRPTPFASRYAADGDGQRAFGRATRGVGGYSR